MKASLSTRKYTLTFGTISATVAFIMVVGLMVVAVYLVRQPPSTAPVATVSFPRNAWHIKRVLGLPNFTDPDTNANLLSRALPDLNITEVQAASRLHPLFVVDTPIDGSHIELRDSEIKVIYSAFGDVEGDSICRDHGTRVSSVIAGRNLGLLPGVTIYSVAMANCFGQSDELSIAKAVYGIIEYCRENNIKGITVSLSSGIERPRNQSQVLAAALKDLREEFDAVIVVAAGNNAGDACEMSPSSYVNVDSGGVISVAASNQSDDLAFFSSWGRCVTLAAPGINVTTTASFGPSIYTDTAGTSIATPLVSALALVEWARMPDDWYGKYQGSLYSDFIYCRLIRAATNSSRSYLPSAPPGTPLRIATLPPPFLGWGQDPCHSYTGRDFVNVEVPAASSSVLTSGSPRTTAYPHMISLAGVVAMCLFFLSDLIWSSPVGWRGKCL
jgi:hypothetical protein